MTQTVCVELLNGALILRPDDTPTQPIEKITATATAPLPLLPRLVEEPEQPVMYVRAPRSPFLFPGIAACVLLAFIGGMFVASMLGVVNLPEPLQAQKPEAGTSAPATPKPDRTKPTRDVPVVATKSSAEPTAPKETPVAAEEPTEDLTPSASPTPSSSSPQTPEPTTPPASEVPTTPPAETTAPTPSPEVTSSEVPTTPADPNTGQPTDTGTPTP